MDEGHKIKNEATDVSEACRRLRCAHRLLLTGTPMQNNLHELWAMLNFLFPHVFVSSLPFDNCFDLGKHQVDHGMLEKAHYLLQPFMLRRVKAEVEQGLKRQGGHRAMTGALHAMTFIFLKTAFLVSYRRSVFVLLQNQDALIVVTLQELRTVSYKPECIAGRMPPRPASARLGLGLPRRAARRAEAHDRA